MELPALLRQGKVSAVNYEAGSVRVIFQDRQDSVSAELPMFNFEYRMPYIGDVVECLFFTNNFARGYCLGTPHTQPSVTGPGIFYKDFWGEAFVKYDRNSKTLTLNAEHIVIKSAASDTKIDDKVFLTHTHSNPEGGQTGEVT